MSRIDTADRIAVRVSGNGFTFSIRRLWRDMQTRKAHQRALVELENLPDHVKRDIGWPGQAEIRRLTHDGR